MQIKIHIAKQACWQLLSSILPICDVSLIYVHATYKQPCQVTYNFEGLIKYYIRICAATPLLHQHLCYMVLHEAQEQHYLLNVNCAKTSVMHSRPSCSGFQAAAC